MTGTLIVNFEQILHIYLFKFCYTFTCSNIRKICEIYLKSFMEKPEWRQ